MIIGVPKEVNLLFEILNVVNQIPTQGAAVDLSSYFTVGQEMPPAQPSAGSPTRVYAVHSPRHSGDGGTPNSSEATRPPGRTTRASSRRVAAGSST